MVNAMVLCAGLGTRLAPLTSVLPKALMPVGDQPVVAHALAALRAGGVREVVVNSHHLSETLGAALARSDPAVRVLNEAALLGTAGGLHHAADALGPGPVIVWNGDIFAPALAIEQLLLAFTRRASAWTWAIAPRPVGQGSVGIDANGDVVRLRGEQIAREHAGAEFIGVSVVGPEIREALPASGCLVANVALPWLRRGKRIATWPAGVGFVDVGTAAGLLSANLSWLAARRLGWWCGAGAQVAREVRLERVAVGPGARVTGEGDLRDTVVFANAELHAPASGLLVAPGALVEVRVPAEGKNGALS